MTTRRRLARAAVLCGAAGGTARLAFAYDDSLPGRVRGPIRATRAFGCLGKCTLVLFVCACVALRHPVLVRCVCVLCCCAPLTRPSSSSALMAVDYKQAFARNPDLNDLAPELLHAQALDDAARTPDGASLRRFAVDATLLAAHTLAHSVDDGLTARERELLTLRHRLHQVRTLAFVLFLVLGHNGWLCGSPRRSAMQSDCWRCCNATAASTSRLAKRSRRWHTSCRPNT